MEENRESPGEEGRELSGTSGTTLGTSTLD